MCLKKPTSEDTCKTKIPCEKIIESLYEGLSREIRELERNYISLIVPLITALGIFGIGLKAYLDSSCAQNQIFFFITTMAALFICIIIWFSANIFGYTHRSNQIVLSRIEKECCLYSSKILPDNWDISKKLSNCEKIDPPEIYKLLKLSAAVLFVAFVLIFLTCTLWCVEKININSTEKIKIILFIAGGVISLVICALFNHLFRWSFCKKSYHQRLKNIAKNLADEKEHSQ